MTIAASTTRVSFACDGTTTVFPVNIQAYLATDFAVILTAPSSAGGGETTLVLNSAYSMAASGTLSPTWWTLTTLGGTPYASGYSLQVILEPSQTQVTQYVQGQAFPSAALQQNLDRLTQMVIRLQDQINRTVIAPDGDVSPTMVLPSAAARGAGTGTFLTFAAGTGNAQIATSIPTGTLSQSTIGALLYPVLGGETGAVNLWYYYGNILRYGLNTVPGTTPMDGVIKTALSAVSAAGIGFLYLPASAGPYLWTSSSAASVPNGVTIYGDGPRASIITTNNVAANIFYENGTGAEINGIGFASTVTNTSGIFVQIAGTENALENFRISGDSVGISITGVAAKVRKGWFGQGAPSGSRISISGGDCSPYLSDILEEATATVISANGLLLTNCTSGYFFNLEMLSNTAGLAIEPGNGQSCDHNVFVACQFDGGVTGGTSGSYGAYLNPTGTGVIGNNTFIVCWTGDTSIDTFLINQSGSTTITGIRLIEHKAVNGAGEGLNLAGTITDVNIIGGLYAGNTAAGIYGGHTGDISIIGARSGPYSGFTKNGTYAVVLGAAITSVVMSGNNLVNTGGTGNVNNATSGVPAAISGNIGYVTRNSGVTGTIASGATVTHGLSSTPTVIILTAQDGTPTAVFPSAIGSTTFAITYTGGGTHAFAWQASFGVDG